MSTPLEIIVTGDVKGATSSLQTVQAELGKTVIAAQKTDSSLQKFSKSFTEFANSGTKSVFILTEKLKELQAVAFTEKDLGKVAKYNAQIQATEKEIAALSNVGKTGFNTLGEAITKAENPIQKAFSGLRTIANIIPGIGISGLVLLVAGPLLDAFENWFAATGKVSDATKLLQVRQSDLNDIVKDASKDAGKQTADLQILYAAATNVNLSLKDRLAAVKGLQDEFPAFFANISKETILNGGAKSQYDELTKSILANATAVAAKSKLDAIQSEQIENDFKKQKILIATTNEINAAIKKGDVIKSGEIGSGKFLFSVKGEVKAIEERRDAALKDIDTNNKLLEGRRKFVTDFIGIAKLASTVETNIKPVKVAKETKQSDPFTISLNELQDNLDKAQALVVGQTNIELQNVQDFLEKKKLLLEKFGKDEGKNDLAIAENKRKIFLDEIKFEASQLIPNIKPSDPTDFAKLAIGKIDTTAGMAQAIKDAQRGFKTLTDEAKKFAAEFQQIMSSTINDTFSGIGEAIGNAIGTGGNLGELVFASLLQTLSSGLEALGKAMIALGTAKIAIENFAIAPGIGTVLAGVAAVALGAILRSAIPHFAGGITNFGGGLALVGERGPEIVSLPRGSNVIPNNQIGASMQSVQVFIPQVTLRGQDFLIAFNRAQQQASRNG